MPFRSPASRSRCVALEICGGSFVMEGGYAIEAIGVNTVNVLAGFLGA